MAIEIHPEDVSRAETFLEVLLTEQIPEGKFTEGSALRDLTVKALAFAFAYLQKENETSRALQSLLTVPMVATTDPDADRAVSQATDAILSNWFVNRKMGVFARGLCFVEVTRRQDFIIPGNHRLVYDRNRVFYPDVLDPTQNIVIRADQLLPVVSVDGSIEAYQFSLRVIAARTGEDHNVPPATWMNGAGFSPYATRVFNSTKFEGGKSRESTQELITRSSTAISVRNLINLRSIEAVLREKFGFIEQLLVIGMGDPEMQRDLKLGIHVGGHTDVFVSLPRVQETFEGIVGARAARPDGVIHVFRDSTVTDWTEQFLDHQGQPVWVKPGDVIRVASGLAESPKDFVIKEVLPGELHIGVESSFSIATDEQVGLSVSYYVYRPLYGTDYQIFPSVGAQTTGQTSRLYSRENALILPGGAHYEIIDVAVTNPDEGDPAINLATGFVHFPIRVNVSPAESEYSIVSQNAQLAQSMHSFEELRIAGYEGKTVRVVYESLAGLDAIHAFTRDRFERVVTNNILVKGFVPVYLSATIPYRLRPLVTSRIDEQALRQDVVTHINAFDPHDIIDVSDLSFLVRDFDSRIGMVLPFTIYYSLIAPDGRVIHYRTSDEVRLDSSRIVPGQVNAALSDPVAQGVSDRTVRYLTTLSRIQVELRD